MTMTPSTSTDTREAPGLSLRGTLGWTILGHAIYFTSQFGVLVALSKMGSTEDVGRFGLAMAIATPIIMFSNLGLRLGHATDIRGEHSFHDYLRLRMVTTTIAVALISAITFISSVDQKLVILIVLVALIKGAESFSDLLYGTFQRQDRMDLVARSMIL